MDSYTEVYPAAAAILGGDKSGRELNLNGLKTLSPEAAKALAKYRGPLFLNGLRSLDAATERIFAKRNHEVTFLQGLTALESRRLAKAVAAAGHYFGDLCFMRLRKLSVEAAQVLVTADGRLSFGGHGRFTPDVNEILGKADNVIRFFGRKRLTLDAVFGLGTEGHTHDGELVFPEVRQLDAEAAAELARYPGAAIHFVSLEEITPEAARAIAPYRGTLDLRGVTTFSGEAAVALANRSAETRLQSQDLESSDGSFIVRLAPDNVFNLGTIRQLTPDLAGTLSAAPILDFCNLKKLSPQTARLLGENHHGSLLLDGLESLPESVAAALALHDGGVSLRRVRHLSLSAAKSLATVRGFVSLGGLKRLGPRLAAELAGCTGNLMLDGVEELTPGVARKLQKHTGMLSMNGLSEISIETAKILAKKPNQKRLVRCGGSIAAVQFLLREDPDRVTMMYRLNSDGAFE